MLQALELKQKPTLLLVDDRPENLVSLEAVLNDNERIILKAQDGEQALSLLLEHDITLVLLDVQMPGMDGYEVARLMKANPRTREIPILFITATQPDERNMLRGYQHGAIDYIYKPFNTEVLRKKVAVLQELQLSRRCLSVMNRSLDEARSYYAAILSTAAEGILVVDEQGSIRYANPAACELLQCDLDSLEGEQLHHLAIAPDSNIIAWENSVFFQHWRKKLTYRAHDAQLFTPSGQELPVTLSCAPLPAPHRGLVVVFLDNRIPKKLQEQLVKQAVTDTLTGLYNRHGFLQSLQASLSRSGRAHKPLAVLYLDLDGFKRINDTLGHPAGDELLCVMADRLRRCTRAYDTVARLGGDEFTIVLDSMDTPEDAARIAEKILDSLATPIEIQGLKLAVSASIGIATYPDCSENVDGMMQAADMAMYQAKSEGRGQYRFFTAAMNGRARARLMLEESLRQAVATEEFVLHYQPQIMMRDGTLRGFEALLRWQHHQAGLVSPGIFVPLLEETGLITRIGSWVIEKICHQRRLWGNTFPQDMVLSANLSARQFGQSELVDLVFQLLDEHQLFAHQLELEVTESSLMNDIEHSQRVLQALRKKGVRIAIDDFGTGYSSLAYLRQFEIDTLKIDRTFIANALVSPKDAAIVEALVALSHSLDVEVVAEGVETTEQLQWLQQIGCDCVQGFLFAKALPVLEAEQYPAKLDFEKL
ncbi:EAL domain-containing response regulator [Permianibacter aggregans]|uniref:cyclic-guanylate-specific phosphodiesterase n=1 Tax=Permianibacter aggregans TaxID=1510150 RepID=A0A4R6UWD6_9GAMM|nr:EAL domain-containing protein [Permianibacter aggregans]QGX39448.1 EAL domain-containing protein [Permianibacter aggregans]TDQ49815.1 response regulator receiver modulated diguanylate cyclase/phosphodiesterase [Permianibacter aggregans]